MESEKVSRKFGMAPGSLVYVGDEGAEAIRVSLMRYNAAGSKETEAANPGLTFAGLSG